MKLFLLTIGIFATIVGILWIGQGLGYINWPASSFMINQITWAYYGICLAIVGLIIIWFSKRR